jgi:hypothetical protein
LLHLKSNVHADGDGALQLIIIQRDTVFCHLQLRLKSLQFARSVVQNALPGFRLMTIRGVLKPQTSVGNGVVR